MCGVCRVCLLCMPNNITVDCKSVLCVCLCLCVCVDQNLFIYLSVPTIYQSSWKEAPGNGFPLIGQLRNHRQLNSAHAENTADQSVVRSVAFRSFLPSLSSKGAVNTFLMLQFTHTHIHRQTGRPSLRERSVIPSLSITGRRRRSDWQVLCTN